MPKCYHCKIEINSEEEVFRCYECGVPCHRGCLMVHCGDYRRYTQSQMEKLDEGFSLPSHLMANIPHYDPSGEPRMILEYLDKDTVYLLDVSRYATHGEPVHWDLWFDKRVHNDWRAADLSPTKTLNMIFDGCQVLRKM